MPRGVYERKPKDEATPQPDGAEKPKRKYKRKQAATPDVKTIALSSVLISADHLEKTVRELMDVEDVESLAFALESYARAKALYEAL